MLVSSIEQGSSTPGTSLWPIRNLTTQQAMSGGWVSETSSLFTVTPHHSHYRLTPLPVKSVAALDAQRSANPTVNCACEGSRLHTPYENLMPDDLKVERRQ